MADQEIDTRLVDAKLKWRAWKMPKPTWDHDHCEFCWAKFMEPGNPDTLPEGYWVEAHPRSQVPLQSLVSVKSFYGVGEFLQIPKFST